jgi:hypothetical protein
MRLIALIALSFITVGCAMNKPPLQRDEKYSAAWPDISNLGAECKDLDGTYANEGFYYDGKGALQSIMLTNIIQRKSHPKDKVVFLKIVPGKIDKNQDSFASLQITVEDDKTSIGCFCIKRTLFYVSGSSGGALPPAFGYGSQQNVWLTKANDGSLVAKIWDYSAGAVFIVPFYTQSYIWARFERIGN